MARVHDPNVKKIVEQLAKHDRDIKGLKNRKPGLAYSSIEDGAIREYDKDGKLVSQTGKQPDGTHGNVVVNGPKPPKPSGLSAKAMPGLIEIRWNGTFANGFVSPLDLKHVAAYVVPSGEVLDMTNQAGVMTGELGDSVQVQVIAGAYYVYLVSWSLAGKFSDASDPVPVLVTPPADPIEIQEALDDINTRFDGVITEAGELGNRLDQAETELQSHEERLTTAQSAITDLNDVKLPALSADLDAAKTDLGTLKDTTLPAMQTAVDQAEADLGTLKDTTLPALDSKVTTAQGQLDTLKDTTLPAMQAEVDQAQADLTTAFGQISTVDGKASSAATAAASAQSKADQASTDAAAAAGIAGGKADVLIQSTTPVAAMRKATTLWIDTTGGANTPKRWSGATWTVVTDKAATDAAAAAVAAGTKAQQALTAAGSAQSTADGALTMAGSRTRVYYSTTAPSGTGEHSGALWRQVDSEGNVIGRWRWTGTQWVTDNLSSEVIDNLDVGKLSAGSAIIQTAVIQKIAAQAASIIELNADRIIAGTIATARLNAQEIAAAVATIIQLNADRITAGTINTARLNASEIAAAVATVINLNASRITAGTINTARLNAAEIAAAVATIIKINADQIIAGIISTDRLDVNAIAGATASFQQVDVANLFATTGTLSEAVISKLWTEVVHARKITVEMLAIGSFDNMVADPYFEDAQINAERIAVSNSVRGPYTSAATGFRYFIVDPAESANRLRLIASADNNYLPVVAGAKYRVRVMVSAASAGPARTYAIATVLLADGTTQNIFDDKGSAASTLTVGTQWAWYDGTVTMPVNAKAAYIYMIRLADVAGSPGGALYVQQPIVTRMSGAELIVDGAVTADKVAANAIKAYHADFDSFFADTGFVTSLRSKGIILVDADGAETLNLTGSGENFISIPDPADPQRSVFTVAPDGSVSAQSLAVTDGLRADGGVVFGGEPIDPAHGGGNYGVTMNGRDTLGAAYMQAVDLHPNMADGNAWMTMAPHGMRLNGWNDRSDNLGADSRWGWASGETRMMLTTTFEALSGRQYQLTYRTPAVRETGTPNASSAMGAARVSYATGSGVVNAGKGTTVPGTRIYLPGGGAYAEAAVTTMLRCPEDIPAGKIMLGVEVYTYAGRTAQSTDTADARRWELSVIDMGMRLSANSARMVDYRTGGVEPPTPDPTPDPDPVKQYTDTISPSWWKAYTGDGTLATASAYSGRAAQGRTPYAPGNGVMRGMVGFPSQASRLSGATVKKIEVYVYADKWHYAAGGTACIGVHSSATTDPSTWSSSVNDLKRQKMKRGQGLWITLPSSVHAGFKSGSYRGITFLPPGSSTSAEYYGLFTGNKTRLRITYTR